VVVAVVVVRVATLDTFLAERVELVAAVLVATMQAAVKPLSEQQTREVEVVADEA
jgi:FlaG/FlaF family flagellin (archaellin)